MAEKLPCGNTCNGDLGCGECNYASEMYKNKIKVQKILDNKSIVQEVLGNEKEKDEKEINCSFYGYKAYSLDVYNDIVVSILFIFDNKKYKVSFNYSISIIQPDKSSGSENEGIIKKSTFINNILIQSKVASGYSEYRSQKNSKYRNMKKINKFIQKVLFEYFN